MVIVNERDVQKPQLVIGHYVNVINNEYSNFHSRPASIDTSNLQHKWVYQTINVDEVIKEAQTNPKKAKKMVEELYNDAVFEYAQIQTGNTNFDDPNADKVVENIIHMGFFMKSLKFALEGGDLVERINGVDVNIPSGKIGLYTRPSDTISPDYEGKDFEAMIAAYYDHSLIPEVAYELIDAASVITLAQVSPKKAKEQIGKYLKDANIQLGLGGFVIGQAKSNSVSIPSFDNVQAEIARTRDFMKSVLDALEGK